jgi:hypothetical protein
MDSRHKTPPENVGAETVSTPSGIEPDVISDPERKRLRILQENLKAILKQPKAAWGVLAFIVLYTIFAINFLGTGCFFASTIGIPCIGCGGTRAAFALMHGELRESLHFHPLLLPAVIIFAAYFGLLLFKGNAAANKLNKAMLVFTVAAVILYIVRMILYFPNAEPMTYNFDSILGRIIIWIKNIMT